MYINTLSQELNGIAIDQYSNLSHSTSQIKDSLHDLDVKYKLLLPYLEQLNQLGRCLIEIAVDQQTKDQDQVFEGGSGLRVPTGACGTATPLFGQFLAQFCQITLTCSKQCFAGYFTLFGSRGGGGGGRF